MDSQDPPDKYNPYFYVGHHDASRTYVDSDLLDRAHKHDYDFLTIAITTDSFHTRVMTLLANYLHELDSPASPSPPVPTISSLSPVETSLDPGNATSNVLAVVSPWIDLCSPDPAIYSLSRQVLELEVGFAAFCGVSHIILPSPKLHHGKLNGDGIAQYASAVQNALTIGNYVQLSITLPMMHNPKETESISSSLAHLARESYVGEVEDWEEEAEKETDDGRQKKTKITSRHDFFGTWDAWNIIRTVCNYNARLFVALKIPRLLPPSTVCSRWHSEPLRILFVDEKTFFTNPKGYPVLTSNHRALINQYMRIRNPPWLLLTGCDPIPELTPTAGAFDTGAVDGDFDLDTFPTPAETSGARANESRLIGGKPTKKGNVLPHLGYIRWMQGQQPPPTQMERFGSGYQDYLQTPLQPLTDNLESVTYEVFEKDPVKYDLYARAITQALYDWGYQAKQGSGQGGRIVVAVVGAGRGPLVTRALQASEASGVPIELWALEKNPNAYVLLQRHNATLWKNQVHLVKSDMRSWKGPSRAPPTTTSTRFPETTPTNYPIDILISELLGSFADNELSPECLDGILPLLNPTHGISIPRSYTAYLTPISAPKLYADISTRATTDPTAPHTPYVVMLHSVDYLSPLSPTSAIGPNKKSRRTSSEDTTTTTTTDASLSGDGGGGGATDRGSDIPETLSPMPNVQPVWTFTHGPCQPLPPDANNTHNERHARISFNLRNRAVCHGLGGYFEAVLYPGVELSTNPLTMDAKSEGMMSWFPIYFPLKEPLYTPDFSTLTVSITRATDNRKVWYEWVVESYSNGGGVGGVGVGMGGAGTMDKRRRLVRLGVSAVGSSREKGCLM